MLLVLLVLLMMLVLLCRWVLCWRRLLLLLLLLVLLPLQGLRSWRGLLLWLLPRRRKSLLPHAARASAPCLLLLVLRHAPAAAPCCRCRCCRHCRSRVLLSLLPGLLQGRSGLWVLVLMPNLLSLLLLLVWGRWRRLVPCRPRRLLWLLLCAVPGRRLRRLLLLWPGLSWHPADQPGLAERVAAQPGWLADRLAWCVRSGPLPAAIVLPCRVLPPALRAGP